MELVRFDSEAACLSFWRPLLAGLGTVVALRSGPGVVLHRLLA